MNSSPDVSLADRIRTLLGSDSKPVSIRELTQRLGLKGEARREIKTVLRRLLAGGEIVKVRGARVGLPARMDLIVGRLSCSPNGYGFVAPERSAGPGAGARQAVFIAAANLKDAMHGDRVVARIEGQSPKGPAGRIIRILERAATTIVGRYESGDHGGYVVPFDARMRHEVFIPPQEQGAAQPGDMVTVEITRPPTERRDPHGRVAAVLGRSDDPGVDIKVMMAKYGLMEGFSAAVEAEIARLPQSVQAEDTVGRTDFRTQTTFTIDPEDARDHDDAVGLTRLPNGHYLLAVHIADVAHYVRPGSAVDEEAYARGTSVYFPGCVIPMLPHALSSHLCSLIEGQDRLTQAALLTIDAEGCVRAADFCDGVIRSAARLTYQDVQKIIDGDQEISTRHAPLVAVLREMDDLARRMRKRRYARGSLDFDLPEPKIILDAAGEMTSIVQAERLDSMRLIEEFMLAANEAVAERLAASGVATLFRIHETPDPAKVDDFGELAASFGYSLTHGEADITPKDFQRILKQAQGRPEERLISSLLLRTLKLARYHEDNLGHFGLAAKMYAHFTSPIRRYPDLVAHRALRRVRERAALHAEDPSLERISAMGVHLSDRERQAAEAERELIEWKKVRFMAGRVGETFTGFITGVQAFGLFVELGDFLVQGLVHVSSMRDDYYHFNERAHTLQGEGTGRVYRLGDQIEVQVARVDLARRMIDFAVRETAAPNVASTAARTRPRPPHRRPVRSGRRRAPK